MWGILERIRPKRTQGGHRKGCTRERKLRQSLERETAEPRLAEAQKRRPAARRRPAVSHRGAGVRSESRKEARTGPEAHEERRCSSSEISRSNRALRSSNMSQMSLNCSCSWPGSKLQRERSLRAGNGNNDWRSSNKELAQEEPETPPLITT